MRHLPADTLRRPGEESLGHLEACDRCRRRLTPDVDLAKVRRRLLDAVAHQGPPPAPRRRRVPRWGMGVAAAVTLVAVIAPALWIASRSDRSPVATSGGSATARPLPPPVELPRRPPEPRPEDTAPPSPPPTTPERPSFEMSFRVGDRVAGRLIWAAPDVYEAVRVNLTDSGWTYDYGVYRTRTGAGVNDPDDSVLHVDPTSPEEPSVTDDPVVPWGVLLRPMAPEEMWSTIGATDGEMVPTAPVHPEAVDAWANGGFRLELTGDHIPVLVDRPGFDRFEVASLDRRRIRTGELGNNTDLPFDYARFLAADTSPEQADVLADGIVTFADYRRAAAAAAACAGTEPAFDEDSGLYVWSDDPTTVDCVTRYVDDIEAVWRLDSRPLSQDEWTEIYYTVHGMPEAAEMYRSPEGPEMPLASGSGWALSISERGPGYCTRSSIPNGFSEGCWVPSQMQVPGVLELDESLSFDGDGPTQGALLGVVDDRVDRVVVRFARGDAVELAPGERKVFSFRGFGLLYDVRSRGVATRVELYQGADLIAAYETQTCSEDHRAVEPSLDRACSPG